MAQQNVIFHDLSPDKGNFLEDILAGLSDQPRTIPPKYFYDETGSILFKEICQCPEYYIPEIESKLFHYHAGDIAAYVKPGCTLLELGSGAGEKIRLLIDSLKPSHYIAVDISQEMLLSATHALANDHPDLAIHAVCTDFSSLFKLPLLDFLTDATGDILAFYPGSSIGNFSPDEAIAFLSQVRRHLGRDGHLLIGVDLKKDEKILNAAYNDADGTTARFNLNLLTRMEKELDAEIIGSGFTHQAFYNETDGRMEMHLVSTGNTNVEINDKSFKFVVGDSIHTENSYKYSIEDFSDIAHRAGYVVEKVWSDRQNLFSIQLLKPDNRP